MLEILKARFQDNKNLHMELSWLDVEKRLLEHPGSMDVLRRMEESGGEPDTIGYDEKTGKLIFCDCAKESPSGRRSLCYDEKALQGYHLEIDLKPGLDEKKLDARVLRDFEKYANREFKNALFDLAGRAMIPVLIDRSGIPTEQKVNTITREQRHTLVQLLKHFKLTVSGPRPMEEAIVTAGGVSLKEIDPRTMQSKLVEGLYFAGEVLDLDAYTGGFNLQIAWSTGYAAGLALQKY